MVDCTKYSFILIVNLSLESILMDTILEEHLITVLDLPLLSLSFYFYQLQWQTVLSIQLARSRIFSLESILTRNTNIRHEENLILTALYCIVKYIV